MDRIELLYSQHGPDLLRYLQRAFAQSAGAEDLLQETFLRAMVGRERLQSAVSARAWLFGIARNVGLDAVRRPRPGGLPDELAAPWPRAEDDRLEMVRAAMDRLPPDQREALELRLTGELSYEEIASVTGVPVGTVRSRLHHAVRRLRGALNVEPGG